MNSGDGRIASQSEISDFIKNLRAFAGQDGQFDAQRYATFRSSLKANPSLTERSVSRVISDDVRAGKVQKLLAGPGYVLPSDVKNQLEQADASWTLVATVDYVAYKPAVPVTDSVIATFFEETHCASKFRLGLRCSMPSSPRFLFVEYHRHGTEVRAYYDQNPARFPKDVGGSKGCTQNRSLRRLRRGSPAG